MGLSKARFHVPPDTRGSVKMVNIPKAKKSFCKKCKKHAPHKVTQYKTGKASLYAQGKRRYDRKQGPCSTKKRKPRRRSCFAFSATPARRCACILSRGARLSKLAATRRARVASTSKLVLGMCIVTCGTCAHKHWG